MNWRRFEKQLIKGGMFVILFLALAIYYLSKQWMSMKASAPMGPPPPVEMYYAHKEEILLWYDKFVIPFVAPAFFYWFHKVVDAKYAKKETVNANVGTDSGSTN